MPADIDKYISEIESLVTQGLYKTALDRVTDFESKFEPSSIGCFKCQILKGKILLQLDEFSDSMDIIDIVLARTEENKRTELYLEALIVKINILYSSGVYNEILSNVSSGEKLIGTLEETKEILLVKAQLLYQKGLFFSIKSEFDESLKLYNLALEIYENQQAERYKADILLDIGRNYRYTGKREKAMEIFKQVLIMSDGFGDISLKALVLNEIGTINLHLGDLYEALLNYKESLDFYKRMGGSTTAIGKVTLNIGVVNEFLGNLAEALSLYEESLSIFKISKNRNYISAAHNNIAGILNKQGKLMDSVNNYEQFNGLFVSLFR
ncbi:MAG: tetratricopeptide repeat protein [Candidatus Heimdallarchaeota archaeon]